jgi:hypothetical protein
MRDFVNLPSRMPMWLVRWKGVRTRNALQRDLRSVSFSVPVYATVFIDTFVVF